MDSSELSSVEHAEELSDRSESSSQSSAGSRSSSVPSEPLQPGFQPYKSIEELTSGSRTEDEPMPTAGGQRFDSLPRMADGCEMPMALDKPKDYAMQRSEVYNESSSSGPFRTLGSAKELHGQKEAMYSFCREIREMRQKSLHAALERSAVVGSGNKDLELIKTYGLPAMKDFGGLTSRIGSIALDRLRAAPLHAGENATAIEPEDLKSLQQLQSRVGSAGPTAQLDATSMAFERLRHAHPLFQGDTGQFTHQHQQQQQQQHQHSHQQQQQQHHTITQIQNAAVTAHQQHQQQQAKSFTIDAILGLRGAGQREKHQRHHTYRKHQGQEATTKSLSSSSSSNSNNSSNNSSGIGGKLKRVRTIFTAEQLERLEGEFARQQYMVGPERLYLAHALRLTEAQVKVWFQNRRIKWRKLNHEQQSQRLHELCQSGMSAAERDDSNENNAEW